MNRRWLRPLGLASVAAAVLAAAGLAPSELASAQALCTVGDVTVPCDSQQIVSAHLPYCAYTHWHGPLNGEPDPNPGGCGHGPVLQGGEPLITRGTYLDYFIDLGYPVEIIQAFAESAARREAAQYRYASDISGPPTIMPPFGQVAGAGAAFLTLPEDFTQRAACDNDPTLGAGATGVPGDDRLLVLCGGSGAGLQAGQSYVTLFGEVGGPIPAADPVSLNYSFQLSVPGQPQWTPLPAFPGDTWQGGSVFPYLTQEPSGTGFFTFDTSVVGPGNTLASAPMDSIITVGGPNVVVFVPADALGVTEENLGDLGFGFAVHVHDGTFGSTPNSESIVSVFPPIPRDGLFMVPGDQWTVVTPETIAEAQTQATATPTQAITTDGSSSGTTTTTTDGGSTVTATEGDGGNGLLLGGLGTAVVISVVGGGYLYLKRREASPIPASAGGGGVAIPAERPPTSTLIGEVEIDEDLAAGVASYFKEQDEQAEEHTRDASVTNKQRADWETLTLREEAVQARLRDEFARVMGTDGTAVSVAGATSQYAAAMDRFKTAFLQITSRSTALQGLLKEWQGARSTAQTLDLVVAIAQIGVGLGKVGVKVGPRLWRWWKTPKAATATDEVVTGGQRALAVATAQEDAAQRGLQLLANEAGVDAAQWLSKFDDVEDAADALIRKIAADRGWTAMDETVEAVLGRLYVNGNSALVGRAAQIDPGDVALVLRWQQQPGFWEQVARGAVWLDDGLVLRFSDDQIAFLKRLVSTPEVAQAANAANDAAGTVRLTADQLQSALRFGANVEDDIVTFAGSVGISVDEIPTVVLKPGSVDGTPTVLLGGAADNTATQILPRLRPGVGDDAPTIFLGGGTPGGAPTVVFGGPGGSLLPPTTFFPPPPGSLDDTVRLTGELAETVRGLGAGDETVRLADHLSDTVQGLGQGTGAYAPTVQWPAPGVLDETVRLGDQLAQTVRGLGVGDETVRLADQFAETLKGIGSGADGLAPTIHWPAPTPTALDETVRLTDQLAETVRGLDANSETVRLADQLAETVRGIGNGSGATAPTIHFPPPAPLADTVRLADQLAETVRSLGSTDETVRLADQLAETMRGIGPGSGAYTPTLHLPPPPTGALDDTVRLGGGISAGAPTTFWSPPPGIDDTVPLADQTAETLRTLGAGDETVRLADQLAETVRGVGQGLEGGAPTVFWRPPAALDETVRLADQFAETARTLNLGDETIRMADQCAETLRGLGQGVDCGAPTIAWPMPGVFDDTVRLSEELAGALRQAGAGGETVRLAEQCSETLRLGDPFAATLQWPVPPATRAAEQATQLVDALRATGADAATIRLAEQVADTLRGVEFAVGAPVPRVFFPPRPGVVDSTAGFALTPGVVAHAPLAEGPQVGLFLDHLFVVGKSGVGGAGQVQTFTQYAERQGWHTITPTQGLVLEDTITSGRLAAAGLIEQFPPQVEIVRNWAQDPVFFDWVATAQVPVADDAIRMFTQGDLQLLQAATQAGGDPANVATAVGPIQQVASSMVTQVGVRAPGASEGRVRFAHESAQIFDSATIELGSYMEQFNLIGDGKTIDREGNINWIEVGISDEELIWGIPGLKLKGFAGDLLFSPIETTAGLWYSHEALTALNEFYNEPLSTGGPTGYDLLQELGAASQDAVHALEGMQQAIQNAHLDRPTSTLGGGAASELRDILSDYKDLFEGMSPEGQEEYQGELTERFWHIAQKLHDLQTAVDGLRQLAELLSQLTPWLDQLRHNSDGTLRDIMDFYNPLLFVRMGSIALALQEATAGTVPGSAPATPQAPRSQEELREAGERYQQYLEQHAAELDAIPEDYEIEVDFSDMPPP